MCSYQDMWQWNGKNVAYYLNLRGLAKSPNYCASFKKSADYLSTIACDEPHFAHFLCETTLTYDPTAGADNFGSTTEAVTVQQPEAVELAALDVSPELRHWSRDLQLVRCPANHSVHAFLACDMQSQCWGGENGKGLNVLNRQEEEQGVEVFNCKLPKFPELQRVQVCQSINQSIIYQFDIFSHERRQKEQQYPSIITK
jgi:hypothetical protein